ncbi:MAG: N-(5'-phosphoribosyl)anthranilate isomerase, partial [Deltaproteobacteria bacterium]
TGESFDWALAVEAKKFGLPIILSGGIGPDNIRDAVSAVKPFAVDVNSKVEIRPGKKSPELIKRLRDALNSLY